MPLSPISSPRFPQAMGFMPLSNQQTADGPHDADIDIPLTTVRTASSTGARKPSQGIDDMSASGSDEKGGRHLFHRRGPAGRRRVEKERLNRHGTGDSEVALNFMGKLYTRLVGASVVTRYLVYVVPVAILLAVPIVLLPVTDHAHDVPLGSIYNTTVTPHVVTVEGPPLFLLFVWIEASWLSLWVGKLVAHLLPWVFMFFCGVVSSGTRKYATVLRALEIPLSLFFWGLASYLVFKFSFTDDRIQWVDVITKILGALFVSSAVFLGEKTIVQLISITYHQRSFANRIKESKREVFLLGLMYDASRKLFPMYCPEFADEDYIIHDSIDVLLAGKRGHKKSGSVTPMRLIGNVGRFGDKITSVFGNIASEITGKQVFNPNAAHSIVVEALEKVRSSEALARRIWMSFVIDGKDTLSLDDIEEVLGPAHKEDAEECFAAIDADGNGDISLDEMIRKVVETGKERKAIANSMKDIGQALAVFDKVLLFLVLLIVIFIFLAFFQSSFITTLATAGTALLSLSFVFAVTTQEFLGSCIFLFVKHPYDVGDRVDIVGPEKEQLTVEKISLLYTVFVRIDRMQVVQVPNIVLNNLWIENVTRSKAMKEVIDVNISYDTSFEDIELLRQEMEKFVRHPDNARDFQPDLSISVSGVGDLDKMQLKIAMKHKSNWHNEMVRATRRSKFMCALALALKKVPIYAPGGGGEALGGPTNPSYSVSVSDEVAAHAREEAAKAKEGKRMVPTTTLKKSSSTSSKLGSKEVEKQAVRDLTANNPAVEAADGWGLSLDDNNTLNDTSRDQSLERKRTRDVEVVRHELISKQESQRGRRQVGQVLPPTPLGEDMPAVQVTRFPSTRSARSGRFVDLESQTGYTGAGLSSPYGANTATNAAAAAQAAQMSPYTLYPPPQAAFTSSSSGGGGDFAGIQGAAAAGAPHPLQSAPTSSATGARSRGASVSRPQLGGGSSVAPGPSGAQRPF